MATVIDFKTTGITSFTVIKASLPPGYLAVRAKASGRKGATRYEIYHGAAFPENWDGDIVHFMPEDVWSCQPRTGSHKDYKFAIDAVRALTIVAIILDELTEQHPRPPF
jgi:hypothetical protein